MKKLLICNFLKHFTGKFEISNVFPFEMYETYICNNEDEFSSLYKNHNLIKILNIIIILFDFILSYNSIQLNPYSI